MNLYPLLLVWIIFGNDFVPSLLNHLDQSGTGPNLDPSFIKGIEGIP